METSVYNIVWADDEIDALLDKETEDELKSSGFIIVGRAHNGIELEKCLENTNMVDAVIVDANFNESNVEIKRERDTSGLTYARSLYSIKLNRKIPFFLFTNRSDELLKEIYQDNPDFLNDFPRHERWFKKSGQGEYEDMWRKIKETVDKAKSPAFIVRNRYKFELNAAILFDSIYEYLFDFLIHEYNGTIEDIKEPFITARRSIEKIFSTCEKRKLIPPISDNFNGTVFYFLNNKYKDKNANGESKEKYTMLNGDLMPKPLALSLKYISDITQDASHSKADLKLKVDEYWENNKDVLLLKSVVFILMDVVKWFATTALQHQDIEENTRTLWLEN